MVLQVSDVTFLRSVRSSMYSPMTISTLRLQRLLVLESVRSSMLFTGDNKYTTGASTCAIVPWSGTSQYSLNGSGGHKCLRMRYIVIDIHKSTN